MATPAQLEQAIKKVRDQPSFLQELLAATLGWTIPDKIEKLEDISYGWSADELHAEGLDKKVVDGQVLQIQPLRSDQPWGIFILEFKHADAFVAGRGMTGPLRRVLRGLVQSRRRDAKLAAWKRENLLFICTHNYLHFRFAYFKAPHGEIKTAPLAAFGWGPDIPARTACEFNLPALVWPDAGAKPEVWVLHWASAFDVEKVTKAFYTQYATAFDTVEKIIEKQGDLKKPEELRMFTQSLFNRLMFLRFIERKGWLEFKGRRDYLRALHEAGPTGGSHQSLYQSRIIPLFFDGLAVEGHQQIDAIGKVPFLNGGLFEESDLDRQVKDIPDEAFAPIISGQGLFYRFNFTVEESTPLDIEVAVDPEMLGKVFEELVTGRHESGSYYTPRPVVSFMCREALKGYLSGKTKAPESAITALVDKHEVNGLTESHAREIIAALDALTAVDPACGSGAYLLGLLQELITVYRLLYSEKLVKDARSLYDLKLRIISHNLYGVDIDPFATNIAMLRLWLSLIVEFTGEKPPALPNLDFKIETGDSLLGRCDVVADSLRMDLAYDTADKIVRLKDEYMQAHGEEKEALRNEIQNLRKHVMSELDRHNDGTKAIDWYVHFTEVFNPTGASFSTVDGKFAFAAATGKQQEFVVPDKPERAGGGFDIVLANPPYVRQELIKDSKPALKKVYGTDFSGTADLYVFFYLRGLQLLAPGGMLVFISSNKWFRTAYGEKLRSLIARTATVRTILDFHDLPVFESAIAYPMIFIASKQPPAKDHAPILAEPPTLDLPYPDVSAVVTKFGQPLSTTALGTDGTWHLASSTITDRFKKMCAAGRRLGEIINNQFYRGVVTGLNEAFYVDEQIAKEWRSRSKTNAKYLKKAIHGEHARRYSLTDSGICLLRIPNGLTLTLLGYDLTKLSHRERISLAEKQTAKAWKVFRDHVPEIAKHLIGFQDSASVRDDRGDFWWELRPCDYYNVFEGSKIVFPQTGKEGRFTIDTTGLDLDQTVYTIVSSDRFLLGVLNSKPVEDFLQGTTALARGGYLRFLTQYLKTLPIPTASASDRSTIATLAQKCLDAGGVGCEAWEKEIDERVASLYGIDLSDIEQGRRPTPIYDTKTYLQLRTIPKLAQVIPDFPYFSLAAIRDDLRGHRGEVESESLNRYLHELTKAAVIFDAGRGWYSTLREPFILDREPVRGLVELLEKRFPLLDFSCWSTAQIAGYSHQQLTRFMSFVHVERDAMESVGDALRALGYATYTHPSQKEVGGNNFRLSDGVVIIRPAITRAPLEGNYATIEKILVDLYVEAEALRLMDKAEYRRIVLNAVSQGRISISVMITYAEDRRALSVGAVIPC